MASKVYIRRLTKYSGVSSKIPLPAKICGKLGIKYNDVLYLRRDKCKIIVSKCDKSNYTSTVTLNGKGIYKILIPSELFIEGLVKLYIENQKYLVIERI
jgi:hypothetical protein